jgi:hypothetical protein
MVKLISFIIALLIQAIYNQGYRGMEHSASDYINLNIDRTIDLTKNILSITSEILIKSTKIDPTYGYRLPILKNNTNSLIDISATAKSNINDKDSINLKLTKSLYRTDDFEFYDISFQSEPMNNEEERILIIKEFYFEKLQPLPKKITLKEDQLVLFKDTINHVSFYTTKKQTTTLNYAHDKITIM